MTFKTFPASIEFLKKMLDFVKAESPTFPQKLELALEEALVNICTHAYPNLPGTLQIGIENQSGMINITIIDEGLPYNPIDYLKEMKKPEIGGLGIQLMAKMAHKIHYERKKDQNYLFLQFNLF